MCKCGITVQFSQHVHLHDDDDVCNCGNSVWITRKCHGEMEIKVVFCQSIHLHVTRLDDICYHGNSCCITSKYYCDETQDEWYNSVMKLIVL